MKNIVFSFYINNSQADYANCMRFINYFQDNNSIDPTSPFTKEGIVKYFVGEEPVQSVINQSNLFQSINTFSSVGDVNSVNVSFILYVNCSNEDDMANFIYFCLLKEQYGDRCILCINPLEKTGKLAANIRDFLKNIIPRENKPKSGRNSNPVPSRSLKSITYYIWSDYTKDYMELNPTDRILRRYSPIFIIDEGAEAAAYWRQSVHSFLLDFYRKNPIKERVTYGENYFLPRIYPKRIGSGDKKQLIDIDNVEDKDLHLILTFVECFCGGEIEPGIDVVRERYKLWTGDTLFSLVKDIPLLAMYIFCILDYYTKDKGLDSIEDIENRIFNARDMADGLLQILENIYHSEKKRGYFCFRIHSNEKGRSDSYLRKQYREYMDHLDTEGEVINNFLEFKIVDYSHNTIPKQFHYTYEKRRQGASEEDKKIYESISRKAQIITVKDFFQNNRFWDSYNAISENAVNHYGLQIFDSLVTCYGGYFRVRSQEGIFLNAKKEAYCSLNGTDVSAWENGIPGTQYDIIIPFKEQKMPQNISVNVNINYTDYLSRKFTVFHGIDFTSEKCRKIFDSIPANIWDGEKRSYQERKELTIRELYGQLMNKLESGMPEGEFIMHFSADKIAITMIELFCKAVMLYIAQKGRENSCYIMITDCTASHFVEITRMFALFYNKQGKSLPMENTQIFLSGTEEGEEFLISGVHLGEVIGRTEKLAFARCVHPECLTILKKMLKNRIRKINPNAMVHIVPFDMIDYDESGVTLFERNLKNVLEKDVQSKEFGCKIENLHVRIGSKIHIRTFFEAELTFHNNYYTSRFAYWLFNRIRDNDEILKTEPITLVGYENYSEMLLNELQEMLLKDKYQSEYIIYEQKALEKFRSGKPIEAYKDTQFIFIVPINSTTSTHVKLSGFLKKSIRNALKEKSGNALSSEYEFGRTVNYGIILIASRSNNTYWEKDKKKDHTIISHINEESIEYYIEVESDWTNPLDCNECFPKDDYTNEVPLVETNKESVVPMHAIGLRDSDNQKEVWTFPKEEKKRLKELSNFLIYNHIERNGNHFSYYFCTEKLWEFPDVRDNIKGWLIKCGKKFRPENEEKKVYDIIAAPLHLSNAAFVEEVNHSLFSNAALVLHFDVNKEYRTNVRAKYSNIQQLYDNLSEDNEESIINFHYVDDTIISGQTFYRTKSLVKSLITPKSDSSVKVNIFRSIVLLISRLSRSSIQNYIDRPEYFLSYFNLNISSMRVNEDACVLCKKRDEWSGIAGKASLNEVHLYWENKCKNVRCKPVEELWEIAKKLDKQHQRRAAKYMIASHRAKSLLESMYGNYANDEIERQVIEDLFPDPQRLDLEELIAVLKVLGRPFLNFRKEGREVIFRLMLKMLDTLLNENDSADTGSDKLDDTLKKLWNNPSYRIIIITILINRLVELESNFIIRKKSIQKIMKFVDSIRSSNKRREFTVNYFNRIKQLVSQSNDFAKCLYLEHLLLYGYEYTGNYMTAQFAEEPYIFNDSEFEWKLYLENTKILEYGIVMLADCVKNESGEVYDLRRYLNENYYFDNFITYLSFHQVVDVDSNDHVRAFSSERGSRMLQGMVQFEKFYEDMFIGKEVNRLNFQKDTFVEMMRHLIDASGAQDGEIIVPYISDDTVEEYVVLELATKDPDLKNLRGNGQELKRFMQENNSFIGDTYAIIERNQQRWILIKFYDQSDEKANAIPVIYMLFIYETDKDRELFTALKNLLVFRNKIWRILNLSSNTLVQNWASGLFYKQQMLKSRATGHGDLFADWLPALKDVSRKMAAPNHDSICEKYFELLVNTAIGHMNVQMLGKEPAGMISASYNLREYWDKYKYVIDAAVAAWDIEIKFTDEDLLMNTGIRSCSLKRRKNQYPDIDTLSVLVLAILQSARKHNERTRETLEVTVCKEKGNLCFKNTVSRNKYREIDEVILENAYRKGQGISMAVIADVCRSWYTDVKYSEIFGKTKEGNRYYFVVQLPILEKEGE